MSRCAAIVLAAGLSRRMGRFKPLLEIGGQALADRVISIFRQNGVAVYLVAGWQQEKLCSGIINRDIRVVENADYDKGMFTSVQAGLRHLGEDCRAFFVMPVDIPLVRPATVKRLLEVFEKDDGKILYPVFKGKRGHPPLVPIRLKDEILNRQPEGGLKTLLAEHEIMAGEILVPDGNILFDIDGPADYDTATERFRRYDIPDDEESEAILEICRVDDARRRHGYRVAEIAGRIGKALREAGSSVDLELIRAGAVLHDIAREQPQHDVAGSRVLRDMGFGRVADIVAVHSFLEEEPEENALEARVVYLADKYVRGDTPVSLDERYRDSARRRGVTPEIAEKIARRRWHADKIRQEMESLIGRSLESLVFG
jgi:CTP:molybdopterin cytidylyltransferase MocA